MGRDYDAAPDYWKKISSRVGQTDHDFALRRLQEAENEAQVDRKEIPADGANEWFTILGKLDQRDVRELTGPWSVGVDASQVDIQLNGRLTPDVWAKPLLESGEDVLVARYSPDSWHGSQFITVANGSFLLNEPLVNHAASQVGGQADRRGRAAAQAGGVFGERGRRARDSAGGTGTAAIQCPGHSGGLAAGGRPLAIGGAGHHLCLCPLADFRSTPRPAAAADERFWQARHRR